MSEEPATLAQSGRAAQMMDVNAILERDHVPPPPQFFESSNPGLGTQPVSKQSFISADVHRREVEHLWKRVWQMACRERALPKVGDYLSYEIADQSIIILRTSETEFKAFHNACQHRGARLVTEPGNLGERGSFQCRFHGWCYRSDGRLSAMPRAWDFPDEDPREIGLAPVSVETWDGWVFVNLDPDCEPLSEFLGPDLVSHFARWPQAQRHLVAHAARVIASNWKAALEAFLEVYHVATTHPAAGIFAFDAATKYDQFGRHGRMHMVKFIAPHGVSEQALVDRWIGMGLAVGSDAIPQVPEGGSARQVLGEYQRQKMSERTGRDFSHFSDAEMLDTVEYLVFPNFAPWGGFGTNLVYRVRPNGNDQNSCIFEVMVTAPDPVGETPPDAPMVLLAPNASWMDAPGMSGLGSVLDEDVAMLERVQAGMHSDGYGEVKLARYQESNIRHLHDQIDVYLAKGETRSNAVG